MQTNIGILGAVAPPMRLVTGAELRLLTCDADAVRVALQYSGITQEQLADRLGKTAGYLSLMLTGKRNWPAKLLMQIARITGCAAHVQRQAHELGLEVYADEVATRRAMLLAELRQIDAEAA